MKCRLMKRLILGRYAKVKDCISQYVPKVVKMFRSVSDEPQI